MAGDILGGALIGGVAGGIIGGLYALVMKMQGKPLGKKKALPLERLQTVPVPPTWKTETKRVLIGLVWFIVIWFIARVVCGAIAGGIASSQAANHIAGYGQGYGVGLRASLEFFQQYGLLVMLGSFAVALLGTLTGSLPGTKRATMIVPIAIMPSEGQWPPPPTSTA